VQPALAAGEPTGWDIIVITNGQTLTKLINLGYLLELPAGMRPNFDANAGVTVKNPAYDPDNRYTMAWQSGITGIAFNPRLTGRDLTSMQDLFSNEFAGQVGMFGDPVDLPNFALLAAGSNPEEATPDEWRAAAELLRTQRAAGVVNDSYRQNYVSALVNGDVAVSMAWSGDIFQSNAKAVATGGTQLTFVVPDEGALIWTDVMCVPRGAQHTVDAISLMDFVYDPQIAAQIASSVNYITPVPGAKDVLQTHAEEASGTEAEALLRTATSPLVFPTEADQAKLHSYCVLDTDEDIAEWNDVFGEFYS
jgi:spermidine/putrescine transport system substrate-binding protein